jgi:hypothetical protein
MAATNTRTLPPRSMPMPVDPKDFIGSPLLTKSLRIVVKRWTFEILEA